MNRRVRLVLGVLLLGALVLVGALMVSDASVSAAGPVAQGSTDEFDANEAQGTVDSVRRALIGIAIGTGVMLVVYIWHTDPRRRFEVATRRRERREADERFGFDDEFVLPIEMDESNSD